METAYDWIAIAAFAYIIVLFMQRSTSKEQPKSHDSLISYLIAGVGCAAVNYAGNNGYHLIAFALIAATAGFVLYALKPFSSS